MEIKIKYTNKNMPKIERIGGNKSDWIDLMSSEKVVINKGDFVLIDLGVCIKVPDGYEAILAPRSSLFKKHGLIQTNSVGVIDESYSGNNDIWKLPVYATRDTVIEEFERICQFRLIKHQPEINFEEVDIMEGSDRGGFGSTGS